MIIKRSYL